jgi:hypothetical protein
VILAVARDGGGVCDRVGVRGKRGARRRRRVFGGWFLGGALG